MSAVDEAGTVASSERPPRTARSTFRAVALPTEHGGWSLTLEPVLLGLLVAWSWSGAALGAAALLAFVARTPFKLILVDRWRGRWLQRTAIAARVASIELLALVILVAIAAVGAGNWFWIPVLAASPLVAIELWFDMRSRGRRLLPELAGSVGIGSVAAAIALADGHGVGLALGLWTVIAARAAAAIPYARTQVLRARRKSPPLWHSDLAQVLAVAAVTVSWAVGSSPAAAAGAISAIGVFNVVAVRTDPRPAKLIGLQQMFFGIVVVVVTTSAVLQ